MPAFTSTTMGLNQQHEATLRDTVRRLSDTDNLTNICPS